MKISIEPAVDRKLKELVYILLEEGYFAIPENAESYVNVIYDFIDTIPRQVLRPLHNADGATYFSHYRPNKRTSWYIIYEIEGENYLIQDVLNNHSLEYNEFIARLR